MPRYPCPQVIDESTKLLKRKGPLRLVGKNKHLISILSPPDRLIGHRRKYPSNKISVKEHVYNRPGTALPLPFEDSGRNVLAPKEGNRRVEMGLVTRCVHGILLAICNAGPPEPQKIEFPTFSESTEDLDRRGRMFIISIDKDDIAAIRSDAPRLSCKMGALVYLLVDNPEASIPSLKGVRYIA